MDLFVFQYDDPRIPLRLGKYRLIENNAVVLIAVSNK